MSGAKDLTTCRSCGAAEPLVTLVQPDGERKPLIFRSTDDIPVDKAVFIVGACPKCGARDAHCLVRKSS